MLFSLDWYCHKVNGLGVCYEVVLSNHDENSIYIGNGLFSSCSCSNIIMFLSNLVIVLRPCKTVVANNGYSHMFCTTSKTFLLYDKRVRSLLRGCHQTVNKRLKTF